MKRLTIRFTSGTALAMGLALAATAASDSKSDATKSKSSQSKDPSAAASVPASASPSMNSGQITVATDDSQKHTERKFTGHEVKGSDGKNLGKVQEFLVDTASGKVEY